MDESLMADAGGLGGRALPSCHSTPAGVITRGEYEAQWVRSSDASQSVSEIAASGAPAKWGRHLPARPCLQARGAFEPDHPSSLCHSLATSFFVGASIGVSLESRKTWNHGMVLQTGIAAPAR